MRLLRTTGTDPELVYFANEKKIPRYAILSHAWGDEEVTFQDMQDPLKRKGMKGWSKVLGACKLARGEDWEHIWIDTCCIDKSSSSELSEAINSMYKYYSQAEICYAYLSDMRSDCLSRSFNLSFRMCKWFTRGWTLQELIAPPTVSFFTNNWEKIGTKASLQETITEITGIPLRVLLQADPSKSSIAARMSWAAGRETTRVEDRAYSLMGMFGVHMPPLYGEGEHAFIRLQEEILKVSNDHSIFAWKSKSPSTRGILATSPDVFEGSGEYWDQGFWAENQVNQPFSMTNMGLQVHLPLLPIINDALHSLAILNCRSKKSKRLAIYVSKSLGLYERIRSDEILKDDAIRAKCGEIEGSSQELLFRAWDLPPFSNNFFSDQIAVFFSGGQGIKPIRVDSSNADFPVSANITDPADHSIGVFTLDGYRPRTFLFRHEPTRRLFVVVAGQGWLDLVLDLKTDKPNLVDIQRSYSYDEERADVSRKNLDRMSKFLTDNVAVLIERRRQYQSGLNNACHIVNVLIIDKIYLHVPPLVPIPIRTSYAFGVSFSSAINAGFSLLDTYPNNAWDKWNADTVNLFLDDASITGTLCFRHEQNRKRFAVTFGFRGKTVWSDVHFLMDTDHRKTAKDICIFYDQTQSEQDGDKNEQGGGSSAWDEVNSEQDGDHSTEWDGDNLLYAFNTVTLSPQDSSPAGDWVLTASVHSHMLRNSSNQYKSEIKVTREWKRY